MLPTAGSLKKFRFCARPDFARKRLQLAALVKSDDDARFEALRKFKVLIMLEPDASQLGRTLLAEASLLKQNAELLATFSDAFASKSTAALVKRAFKPLKVRDMDLQHAFGQRSAAE